MGGHSYIEKPNVKRATQVALREYIMTDIPVSTTYNVAFFWILTSLALPPWYNLIFQKLRVPAFEH